MRSIVAHERMSRVRLYKLFFQAFGTLVIAFLLDYSSMGSIGILCILNGALGFFRTFSLYVLL